VGRIYFAKQIADRLGVSTETVRWWSKNGRFVQAFRVGRRWAWRADEVDAYVAQMMEGNVHVQAG
jgi:excisionase family DNA binding protein